MVCQFLLYNKVNQLYIYIHLHISFFLCLPPPLPIPPLQVDTKHRADLPVLCGCFPLAIYFMFDSVYMTIPLSHFVPAYSSLSPCPQVNSQHIFYLSYLNIIMKCCKNHYALSKMHLYFKKHFNYVLFHFTSKIHTHTGTHKIL